MKKIVLTSIVAFTIIVACNKSTTPPATTPAATPDTTPPVITMKGNVIDSVTLGKQYSDAGATALDNVDGDLTSFIVYSGAVTTTVTGTYTLGYIVRDAAGNNSIKHIRTIKVKNDADFLIGNYAVTCTCTTSYPSMSPTNTVVTSNFTSAISTSSVTNTIFSLVPYHEGYTSQISTLSGSSLNITYQKAPPTLKNSVTGTSTLSANNKTITLNTTETYFSEIGKKKDCQAVYVKQ